MTAPRQMLSALKTKLTSAAAARVAAGERLGGGASGDGIVDGDVRDAWRTATTVGGSDFTSAFGPVLAGAFK